MLVCSEPHLTMWVVNITPAILARAISITITCLPGTTALPIRSTSMLPWVPALPVTMIVIRTLRPPSIRAVFPMPSFLRTASTAVPTTPMVVLLRPTIAGTTTIGVRPFSPRHLSVCSTRFTSMAAIVWSGPSRSSNLRKAAVINRSTTIRPVSMCFSTSSCLAETGSIS